MADRTRLLETILSEGLLEMDRWYTLWIRGGAQVSIEALGSEARLRFYTGHLLQIAEIMQPAAPKNGTLYLKMTEPVAFQADWAHDLFMDEDGMVLPSCLQLRGSCAMSGDKTEDTRDISVVFLDPGAGARVAQVALLQPDVGPSTTGRAVIDFAPCSGDPAGARCATF